MLYARLYRPDLITADDTPCGFAVLRAGFDVSDLATLHTLATQATQRHSHATAYQIMAGYTFAGARSVSLKHTVER